MIARVLRGGACTETGEIVTRSAPGWSLALSKGLESPARKVDPNEDACGVVAGGIGAVAVVADAHYGRMSAEVSVDHLLGVALQEPPPRALSAPVIWEWLREHLSGANAQVRARQSTSACAILAVVVQGRSAWWASIGDCRLYRIRGTDSTVCNPLRGTYLGDRGLVEPEVGQLSLEAGDRLVLASDGLPECRYGQETLSPSDVAAAIAGCSGEAAARALVTAALDGGGEDNIAVIVGEM